MKHWKVWLGILIIFLSGAVAGSFATVHFIHSHIRDLIHNAPESFNDMAVVHLDKMLDLSDEQEATVAEVVAGIHHELMIFKTEHGSQITGIIEQGLDRMKTHLTPEQSEKLDSLHRHIKEELRAASEKKH